MEETEEPLRRQLLELVSALPREKLLRLRRFMLKLETVSAEEKPSCAESESEEESE